MNPLLAGLVVAAALLALAAAVFILGMRHKSSPVVAAMRRINRRVFNPRQLRTAGTEGAYAAAIHHRGRTSGRAYDTPVGAVPCADGFAVALMYGRRSDWLLNLQAHGGSIRYEDRTYPIVDIELRPADRGDNPFPPSDQRSQRLFGVQDHAILRTASPTRGEAA
jgi:deazaflavin-dependent oxidoreductase (nitroreductase family)